MHTRILCLLSVFSVTLWLAPSSFAEEEPIPAVGMSARLEVVLPGPELEALPIENRDAPLVLRVIHVAPAEQGFRYELEYVGFVPGRFDLRDYLRRKNRTPITGLPPIRVRVQSVLPPGQTLPNPLGAPATPRPGGYRVTLIVGGCLWVLGLLGLIWIIRRRRAAELAAARPTTLADHLRPLVEDAIAGRAAPARLADLERSLISYWSRKLGLSSGPPAEILPALRQHAEAGPLLVQLESWLHGPQRPARIDLATLLAPYRSLPATALETIPGVRSQRT